MKLLIMCEGPNELEIVKILLRHHKFKFNEDDLLGLVPYHARQIKNSGQVKTVLNICTDKVKFLRIGDKQNDALNIPQEYREKISSIQKYCTKPELEILLIHSENLFSEYCKVKSSISPKQFAKQNIRNGKTKYNNSTKFYSDYYGSNCEELVHAIKLYRQKNGSHNPDELYLADLLK